MTDHTDFQFTHIGKKKKTSSYPNEVRPSHQINAQLDRDL